MNENKSVTPAPSGVSRRTVVKGAAWAVPAIAVASSVPAMAASRCIEFTIGPNSCKLAGNFEYQINLCFESTCADTSLVFPVQVTRIETGNDRVLTVEPWANSSTPGATPVTATYTASGQCVLLVGNTWSNPSTLVIYYSLNGVAQPPYVVDAPPIQGGCEV
ncbi:MAG: hypothetical protein EOL89_14770 [Actinobacteria bacterium]|nr:hypothetical protein [Actinomycetota bacterium]